MAKNADSRSEALCPNLEELVEFIERADKSHASEAFEEHIEHCESCQQSLWRIVQTAQAFSPDHPFLHLKEKTLFVPSLPEIPGFKIIQQLGEGGMGVVFEADEVNVGRKVAIKFIRGDLVSKSSVERFDSEANLLANVTHPNIASLYQAGEYQGCPFFVMEYVEGANLFAYCQENDLVLRERLELFLGVCDAIQHLHARLIVHRDLTTNNILVTSVDGVATAKVIDFGLAKLLNPRIDFPNRTAVNAAVGTPAYMSPEQTGETQWDIGTATDVYSLGTVLYELLTGEPPLGKKTLENLPLVEIFKRVREEEASAPSKRILSESGIVNAGSMQTTIRSLQQEAKNDLDWIVLKAIRKEPDNRYESVSAFGEDIRRYLANQPVKATPRSKYYLASKFLKRNRLLAVSVATIASLLVVGVIALSYGILRVRAAERTATLLAKKELRAKEIAEELREKEKGARLKAERAAIESEERRTKMQKASLLLRGFFNGINPEIAGAGDGKFRGSMIERLKASAVEILDEDVSEDEDVILLKESLANALISLGEPEAAMPLWENIASEITSLKGSRSIDTLAAILNLGRAYWNVKDYRNANVEFERARKLGAEILDSDDVTAVIVDHYYAANLEAMGKLDESIRIRKAILQHPAALENANINLRVDMLNGLGATQLKLGSFEAAKETLEEAVAGIFQSLSKDHPIALKMRGNLVFAKQSLKDYQGAVKDYRDILNSYKKQYPENSMPVGTAKLNLAVSLSLVEKRRQSIELLTDIANTASDRGLHYRARVESCFVKFQVAGKQEGVIGELKDIAEKISLELGSQHPVYQLAVDFINKNEAKNSSSK